MTLPPGLRSPALVQTLSLVADPIAFFDRASARYGDTFTTRVLGLNSPPVVFLSNPDAIQAVFTTLADAFEFGKVTHVFRPLVGNESLIMQEGARHQRQRQLLMPALHREQLHSQGHLICQLTQKRMIEWSVGETISIRSEMSEISLQVILQVVFGLVPGVRYERLKQLLAQLLEAITSPLYSTQFFFPMLQQNLGRWSPWGQFLEQMAQIDELIYAEIVDRRSQSLQNRTDILSVLMMARDEQGESMSDQELRDQLMTLLLLGHETTASGLTWAFYWLHRNQESLDRLRQELESLGENPDPVALSQAPYLTAVCKEALRVYPIALISQPRKVKRTIEIEGYTYEPGTILIPCIYLAHRREKTYEHADQFNPDRFINQKFSAYEYLPFGGGSRSCVGMALSMFEMKLVLATVLSWYDFETTLARSVHPARRGITFVPPDTFRLKVVRDRAIIPELLHNP
ncbi:cytochrome P450 [Leptolyngbya sp. DQ-M1]|uniref:cytochrome P450 n=1 Tax=Leptolyngbya sp. DQ-M1 TaxID=2933920 RepID=UPI00329899A3